MPALALLGLGLAGCQPDLEKDVNVSAGAVDFTTYVAVGNSLTAGFSDGGLYLEGQQNSYPNLLAQQFKFVGGGDFAQPPVPAGPGKRLGLLAASGPVAGRAARYGHRHGQAGAAGRLGTRQAALRQIHRPGKQPGRARHPPLRRRNTRLRQHPGQPLLRAAYAGRAGRANLPGAGGRRYAHFLHELAGQQRRAGLCHRRRRGQLAHPHGRLHDQEWQNRGCPDGQRRERPGRHHS